MIFFNKTLNVSINDLSLREAFKRGTSVYGFISSCNSQITILPNLTSVHKARVSDSNTTLSSLNI